MLRHMPRLRRQHPPRQLEQRILQRLQKRLEPVINFLRK
jgi:hypothetical protein